jgi:hypothetical protein
MVASVPFPTGGYPTSFIVISAKAAVAATIQSTFFAIISPLFVGITDG